MSNVTEIDPRKAIMAQRIIWAALILGQLAFAVVVALLLQRPGKPPPPEPILSILCFVFLIEIPIGLIARQVIFARGRRSNGRLTPGVYGTGNIIFWAMCEGASFFALVVVLINHSFWPTIVVPAIALCFQAVTIPMGSAFGDSSY
jgi:F0F1-type ATP synthase membrane subunit c/vacuolar-type H+-ATPase subunit K